MFYLQKNGYTGADKTQNVYAAVQSQKAISAYL